MTACARSPTLVRKHAFGAALTRRCRANPILMRAGGECVEFAVGYALRFVQENVLMVAIGGAIIVLMLGSFLYLGCQKANRRKLSPEAVRAAQQRVRTARRLTGRTPVATMTLIFPHTTDLMLWRCHAGSNQSRMAQVRAVRRPKVRPPRARRPRARRRRRTWKCRPFPTTRCRPLATTAPTTVLVRSRALHGALGYATNPGDAYTCVFLSFPFANSREQPRRRDGHALPDLQHAPAVQQRA